MLFNSLEFICLFLPLTLCIFFLISKLGYPGLAIAWLAAASLFFYAWWNPPYLALLIFSILFNYCVGSAIAQRSKKNINQKLLLILGVAFNLALIIYFKYTNFLVSVSNEILGTSFTLNKIILPIGISFFTFQQIAYLIDIYRENYPKYRFLEYCLFVTFFPQLIAGPIVHHKEVIPQFANQSTYKINPENIAVGITIFFIGLFKKVILADSVAAYATPVFTAAAQGVSLTCLEAWIGAIAFTLQLYFDFSGYSDMAIGAARLFGIKLPINFNSPYKAVNISEFWRRWHITLSNFLRDYLYIPLGGNRTGEVRRNINLMITMLLGGFWHGAGWTFIFWGGLHGVYLIINHHWRSFRKYLGHDLKKTHWWNQGLSCSLTFIAVVVGWVFFRADRIETAIIILKTMSGINVKLLPKSLLIQLPSVQNWEIHFNTILPTVKVSIVTVIFSLFCLILIVWLTPNTQQWMKCYHPALEQSLIKNSPKASSYLGQKNQWQPTRAFGVILGALIFWMLKIILEAPESEFLYFNF